MATFTDLQWALEQTPWKGGELPLLYRRGEQSKPTQLQLQEGWRQGTPLTYAWRPYKWELRLQDEIAPDFTIDEKDSHNARKAFEKAHPEKVEALIEAERERRAKSTKMQEKKAASPGPLFDTAEEPAAQGAAGQ